MALPNIGNDPISKALSWLKQQGGSYLQNLNPNNASTRLAQGAESNTQAINPQPNTGAPLIDAAINTTRNINPFFDAAYKFAKMPDKNPINMVKNTLKGIENTVGMDVEHGQFLPDAGKAINNAIDNPVNTAIMAVSPFAKGSNVDYEGNPITQTTSAPAATETSSATNAGNRILRGQYNLSPKTSQIFTQNDINTLADYGITKPKDVATASEAITGSNGIGTKLVRGAISNAKPVPLGQLVDETGTVTSPGLADIVKNIEQNMDLATPTARKSFTNTVLRYINKGGENLVEGDPLEMYDFMKSLESKAANYRRMATPEALEQANAYSSFANELEDRIFNNAGANTMLNKTPITMEDFNKLNDISPKLAQDTLNIMKNGTVSDLRSLQAPFVKGSKAVAESMARSGNTPLSMRQVLELYIATHGNPAGAAIALADTGIGKNLIGNTLRAMGNKEGLPAPNNGMLAPIGSGAVLSSMTPLMNQNGNNDNGKNTTNNTHSGNITPTGSNVKFSASTPLDDGTIMSEAQYAQSQQALQAKMGGEKLSDPQAYNEDMARYQQNEIQFNAQNNLRQEANNTKTLVNTANQAYPAVEAADPSIINVLSKGWDQFSKADNGKYSQLSVYLQQLSKLGGVDLSTAKSKDALLSAINAIVNNQNTKLGTAKDQYFGTTDTKKQKTITNYVPPAPQGPPPPENANSIVGGNLPDLNLPQLNLPNIPQ